jgi:WD40 repeat protein/energy-coupling factor transporter ATP-binding protein EcfA2
MNQYPYQYPYPGLRPFQKHEADIFFGREEQIEGMLQKLWKNRFVAIVGPSGCGKSSLVNAGLLPSLKRGFLLEAGENWRIAVFRPGIKPIWNMAEALYRALNPLLGGAGVGTHPFVPSQEGNLPHSQERNIDIDIAFLAAGLKRGPLGIAEAFREARLPEDTNLLVLADQFEEIFRFREQQSVNENEADRFVNLLLASANVKGMRIYTGITMRSDYLGDCALFMGLPEAMNDSQFLVPRLTRDQQRAAITGPAAQFDAVVEPILVNRLLNDMGPDPDQLPLLQHALMRMWSKGTSLNVDNYESIGGLENALSKHADQIYDELTPEQQRIAEILFRCLSERASGKRDTRRPVKLSEPAEIAQVEVEAVKQVVDAFRAKDRNFLTPPPEKPIDADTVIDISHESLIRQWKKLKDWVEKEAESAEMYRRLENTALLWKNKKAALWGSPDLDNAVNWKEIQKPTPQWAKRYGEHFDSAMAFLEESEKKQQAEIRQKEIEQKEKISRIRKQLGFAIAGLIIAVCLAFWGYWERGRAEKTEKARTQSLFESRLTHASLQARVEDYAASREILKKTYELDNDMPQERRHARNLMNWYADLMGGTADKVYEGAGTKLLNVAISPDGKLLAGVGEKGTVVLFDEKTGDVVKRLEGHDNCSDVKCYVNSVTFDPKGKWLATSGEERKIILWSIPEGVILRRWEAPAQVEALALSPDGKMLASGGFDNNITLWDAETGTELKKFEGHEKLIQDIAFSPDGSLLASASYDRTAIIWDLKTGKAKHILKGHTGNVKGVSFHPEGNILASSSSDKSIILWNIKTGRPMAQFLGHVNYLAGLTFTDKGRRLISASLDRTLRIWDTETGVTLRVLQGHTAGVIGVIAKGDDIYSAANDGTIRRWKQHTPNPSQEGNKWSVVNLKEELNSSAISPDGSKIAVGFADGKLQMFSLPYKTVTPAKAGVQTLKTLDSGFRRNDDDGIMQLALQELKLLWEKSKAHSDRTFRLAFSPDGKQLASGSLDNTVKLWNADTGELIQTFEGHTDVVHAVAFSPDGKFIASASYDGKIGLFEIGKKKGELFPAHDGKVYSVAFDASGKKLVSAGSEEGELKIWNIQKSKLMLIKEFPKSGQKIMWATLSPDGKRVAAVGRDNLVHIFNADTEKEEHAFVGHEQAIFRVEFSADGGQVATAGSDNTIRFWDLETKTQLFSIHLPANIMSPPQLWDFSYRSLPNGDALVAVPLTSGKLVLYRMDGVYRSEP